MTIRQRAIELANQPDFDASPVEVFTDVSRAKLEVDAYLAIGINSLTARLGDSQEHRKHFKAVFSKLMFWDFLSVPDNTAINYHQAVGNFQKAWQEVYVDDSAIGDLVYETPQGEKIRQSAQAYVRAAETTCEEADEGVNLIDMYDRYRMPALAIRQGLATFGLVFPDIISAINNSEVGIEEREQYLQRSARSLRARASLSIAQLANYLPAPPTVDNGQVNIVPDIARGRELPRYAHPTWGPKLRPHMGCPALFGLPEGELLRAGSGIGHLWSATSELIVATNMHALDSSDPTHHVLKDGLKPYTAYFGHSRG